MDTLVSKVIQTRAQAAALLAEVLPESTGRSEREVRDAIRDRAALQSEWYPDGWYDPPEGGVAVLFGDGPQYERLQFDSLRSPQFFASNDVRSGSETVGLVYVSPVDRATGMIGDIGFSFYRGEDVHIQQHLKACHDVLLASAHMIEVGMPFRDIYHTTMDQFAKSEKKIGWMTTDHDPLKINLGHTVPASLGECVLPQGSFEEVREAIRSSRLYINAEETFRVPATGAFTLEARLTDMSETLPNAFFHFIVTFSDGKRDIRSDFGDIFTSLEMHYMV